MGLSGSMADIRFAEPPTTMPSRYATEKSSSPSDRFLATLGTFEESSALYP